MAEFESHLSTLDIELTCSICMEVFGSKGQRPRMLSCGHSFCHNCLSSSVLNGKKQQECPTCRSYIKFTNVTEIPINYGLKKLAEDAKQREKIDCQDMCILHNSPKNCECIDCEITMCGICGTLDHKGCKTIFINKTLKKMKSELQYYVSETQRNLIQRMQQLEEDASELQVSNFVLDDEIDELERKKKVIEASIKDKKNKCVADIDTSKAIHNEINKKKHACNKITKGLSDASSSSILREFYEHQHSVFTIILNSLKDFGHEMPLIEAVKADLAKCPIVESQDAPILNGFSQNMNGNNHGLVSAMDNCHINGNAHTEKSQQESTSSNSTNTSSNSSTASMPYEPANSKIILRSGVIIATEIPTAKKFPPRGQIILFVQSWLKKVKHELYMLEGSEEVKLLANYQKGADGRFRIFSFEDQVHHRSAYPEIKSDKPIKYERFLLANGCSDFIPKTAFFTVYEGSRFVGEVVIEVDQLTPRAVNFLLFSSGMVAPGSSYRNSVLSGGRYYACGGFWVDKRGTNCEWESSQVNSQTKDDGLRSVTQRRGFVDDNAEKDFLSSFRIFKEDSNTRKVLTKFGEVTAGMEVLDQLTTLNCAYVKHCGFVV